MGFKTDKEYAGPEEGSGAFIGADEKAVLIYNKVVFPILGVRGPVLNKFGNRQYLCAVTLPDEEDEVRTLAFSADSYTGRAEMLRDMQEYFDAEGESAEPIEVFLERDGKAVSIRLA
jgi:hypothetical protein